MEKIIVVRKIEVFSLASAMDYNSTTSVYKRCQTSASPSNSTLPRTVFELDYRCEKHYDNNANKKGDGRSEILWAT